MNYSKLSSHEFKKGKFITPMHTIPNIEEFSDDKSWTSGRLPEYLWIGLILKHFGRELGLNKLCNIIFQLHKLAPDLTTVRLSQILKLDSIIQEQLYEYIISIGVKEALSPLTVFLTISYAPIFAKKFYCSEFSVQSRCDILIETMKETIDYQSNEATDIRFIALYFYCMSGKLHIPENQVELLISYPNSSHNDEIMRIARPTVRSMEMMILSFETTDSEYLKCFWRCISEMTECTPFAITFPKEKRNITVYMENLHEVFAYLSELFTSSEPLNEKMNVLLGISTYSYKRLKEVYEHNLFNSISGRSCVRVLIEDYIMMKYLIKNETSHDNIWRDYQFYGIGLYKLILMRHRENAVSEDTHFDKSYIEALVNEFKEEEYIDMDTSYFDKQNIRGKAENVNEKNLYGLYYDYDSSFEHGLWGAIRESSLLKCNNPAHKYHCVPDIDDQIQLKTVLPDCIMVMNKIVKLLDELYGIPEQLLNEVINFEFKSVVE